MGKRAFIEDSIRAMLAQGQTVRATGVHFGELTIEPSCSEEEFRDFIYKVTSVGSNGQRPGNFNENSYKILTKGVD